MNPAELTAQARQAAAQGQALLSQDQSQSSQSQGNYNAYSAQANQATQQAQQAAQKAQAEAQYMQGAGSGANVYNTQLQNQISQFDPNIQGQLSSANKSLFGLTGALNSAANQFNTPGGVGAYGLSAPALASYASSVLNPLQTGTANANTQVNALNQQLGTLQTGANQATTAQVQTEQGALTGFNQTAQQLTAAATAYQNQAATALQNMQFFSQLAQTQGGLNAQEQQYYAQSIQGYETARAAMITAQAAARQAAVAAQIAPSTIAEQQAMAKYYSPTTPSTSKSNTSSIQGIPLGVANPTKVANLTLQPSQGIPL